MTQIVFHPPGSPKAAFSEACRDLEDVLYDEAATVDFIADAFAKVLELLECVPTEKPIYAAAKAVLTSGFRDVCRQILDGSTEMGVRRGTAKDVDVHSKKVIRHSWI